ncbi:MAG: tetratricopeptide repeat protein [Acidobacteriota bacterium]
MSEGGTGGRWKRGWAALLLLGAVLAVFWPLLGAPFLPYDDQVYVTDNPRVKAGLNGPNLRWAFTDLSFGFYYPLTWLSHMADVSLFGLDPRGHHGTSVLLHLGAALILFAFLDRATGRTGPSLFAALLFAVHPLHVESVAWIAERKDVLSTLFFFGALLAYAAYGRRPSPLRYAAVFLLFALALLAKSMVVTGPFLLLLLDLWPLGRLPLPRRWDRPGRQAFAAALRPLLLEKVPLLGLSLGAGLLTVAAQHRLDAFMPLQAFPFSARVGAALAGYADYLWKTLWPVGLVFLPPLPEGGVPLWMAALSALLLAGITLLALREARRRPWFLSGWLWFLLVIAPVSGLIQAGPQWTSDHYTYVALVGPFWALSFEGAGLLPRHTGRRRAFLGAAGLLLLALGARAWDQARLWRDPVAFFEATLRRVPRHYGVLNALGTELLARGQAREAAEVLKRATALKPWEVFAWMNLGPAFAAQGKFREAEACYRYAAGLRPEEPSAWYYLGKALEAQRRWEEAAAAYGKAARFAPGDPAPWEGLARSLLRGGIAGGEGGREALKAAERACALTRGEKIGPLALLVEARRVTGDQPGALRARERALQLLSRRPDPEGERLLVEAAEGLGGAPDASTGPTPKTAPTPPPPP